MKIFLIVAVISILLSASCKGQKKYWSDLTDSQKTEIVNACHSESIKMFYTGKLILTDDDKTDKLLKDLVFSDNSILPLSFYLFNRICEKSDGSLAEMVSGYCIEYLAKHPEYILTYFTKERLSNVRKPIWRTYALFIGSELYFKKIGTSDLKYDYNSYKKLLEKAAMQNSENKKTLMIFWQSVDKTFKNMD